MDELLQAVRGQNLLSSTVLDNRGAFYRFLPVISPHHVPIGLDAANAETWVNAVFQPSKGNYVDDTPFKYFLDILHFLYEQVDLSREVCAVHGLQLKHNNLKSFSISSITESIMAIVDTVNEIIDVVHIFIDIFRNFNVEPQMKLPNKIEAPTSFEPQAVITWYAKHNIANKVTYLHSCAQCVQNVVHNEILDVITPTNAGEVEDLVAVSAYAPSPIPPDAIYTYPNQLGFPWASLIVPIIHFIPVIVNALSSSVRNTRDYARKAVIVINIFKKIIEKWQELQPDIDELLNRSLDHVDRQFVERTFVEIENLQKSMTAIGTKLAAYKVLPRQWEYDRTNKDDAIYYSLVKMFRMANIPLNELKFRFQERFHLHRTGALSTSGVLFRLDNRFIPVDLLMENYTVIDEDGFPTFKNELVVTNEKFMNVVEKIRAMDEVIGAGGTSALANRISKLEDAMKGTTLDAENVAKVIALSSDLNQVKISILKLENEVFNKPKLFDISAINDQIVPDHVIDLTQDKSIQEHLRDEEEIVQAESQIDEIRKVVHALTEDLLKTHETIRDLQNQIASIKPSNNNIDESHPIMAKLQQCQNDVFNMSQRLANLPNVSGEIMTISARISIMRSCIRSAFNVVGDGVHFATLTPRRDKENFRSAISHALSSL